MTKFVLVPVEPTETMLEVLDDAAWFDEGGYLGQEASDETYRKLLAAASQPDHGVGALREVVAKSLQETLDHLIDPAVLVGATLRAADRVLAALKRERDEAVGLLAEVRASLPNKDRS